MDPVVNWWRAKDWRLMDAGAPFLIPRLVCHDRSSWIASSTVRRTNSPVGPESGVQVTLRHHFPNGRLEPIVVVQNWLPNI